MNPIYRKGDGWEFRAIETTTSEVDRKTNYVYGISENGRITFELYRGENYIVGDTSKSWSRCYKNLNDVPKKYKYIFDCLVYKHENTDWKKVKLNAN